MSACGTYVRTYVWFVTSFCLTQCATTTEEVALKLLASVADTLKPLVSSGSTAHGAGAGETLSPGAEQTTGKLLELALEMGVKVRTQK